MKSIYLPFLVLLLVTSLASSDEIDPNGYLVYCPCMGK